MLFKELIRIYFSRFKDSPLNSPGFKTLRRPLNRPVVLIFTGCDIFPCPILSDFITCWIFIERVSVCWFRWIFPWNVYFICSKIRVNLLSKYRFMSCRNALPCGVDSRGRTRWNMSIGKNYIYRGCPRSWHKYIIYILFSLEVSEVASSRPGLTGHIS